MPELTAKLVQFEVEDKGQIIVAENAMDAMVLHALGGLNFLHIGDGYTMSYDINIEEGVVKYSASGNKSGFGKGTCSEVTN
jgi:hypothetical protein